MKKLALLLILILSLILTACGAPAKFPTGKFVADNNPSSYWEFNSDGTWSFQSPSGLPLEGTYTTDGSTYTETFNTAMFNDSANCNKSATYTWSYSGSRLTFKTTTDQCEARQAWYTNTSFVWSK